MDPAVPEPEVLVVEDGRVAAVGERALLDAHPGAVVEDLAGRALLPGFIDAHHHLCVAALTPVWADLTGATGEEDVRRALLEQAEREREADWVRGAQWDHTVALDRHVLDELDVDRPVMVAHYSLHQCVVSSRALDVLGIGRSTADPEGGRIERGPDGEPTGVLVERAWSEANRRSLAAYSDPDRWGEHIVAWARVLLRDGITAVHDAACFPSAEAVYERLAAEGSLPVSVVVMPHDADMLSNAATDRLEGRPTGEGDEALRVGPAKFFADGGIAPAIDALRGGRRFAAGIMLPRMADGVKAAAERGFRVAVHAMGNAGLDATLDAFEEVARRDPDSDHRFRVEHATLASRDQVRRMADLGAVAVVQPGFVDVLGRAVHHVALDDATWMPFRALLDAGVPVAASSDHPCGPFPPADVSVLGVTRQTLGGHAIAPEEAVSYEEWLRAYTAGAAYAGGQQDERGTLARGKRADLVVLDGDLTTDAPPRVVETWIGGEQVFSSR